MTQLIIDNMVLPESLDNGYTVERESLHVDVEMISGRIVREVRGWVWRISYQYGYFSDEDKNKLIRICEKGMRQPITCNFLEQEYSGQLKQSQFIVTSFKRPRFVWRKTGADGKAVPVWLDFSVELREVSAHA
jgi:hypothetical protein